MVRRSTQTISLLAGVFLLLGGASAHAAATKVSVCHVPNEGGSAHTAVVNENALQGHLDHGDTLGECAATESALKADVCHIPEGNAENAQTITVSVNAVPAHLAHGDFEGPCEGICTASCGDGILDEGEACELAPVGVGSETCLSQGQILGGTLRCGAGCQYDFGDCTGFNYVFVTSTTYTGDLGGVAGADAKCQERAVAAGLPGVYKAWISAGEPGDATSPSTTFAQSPSSYVLVDGTVIATSWADLVDGSLDAPIVLDENGVDISDGFLKSAWTATKADGTPDFFLRPSGEAVALLDCAEWTNASSAQGRPRIGYPGDTTSGWSSGGDDIGCEDDSSSGGRLYCFQQ